MRQPLIHGFVGSADDVIRGTKIGLSDLKTDDVLPLLLQLQNFLADGADAGKLDCIHGTADLHICLLLLSFDTRDT